MSQLQVPRSKIRGSFVRFGLQAGLSMTVSMTLPYGLVEVLAWRPEYAVFVTFIVVFFMNYAMCRYFVFDATCAPVTGQLAAFALSTLGFRSLEYIAFLLLHSLIGFPYLPVLLVVFLGSFFLKFWFYSSSVFR